MRHWLRGVVIPVMLILIAALIIGRSAIKGPVDQDHAAVIIGFFAFYFVLVRGGHIYMIRSMHLEMKEKFEAAYKERLSKVPDDMSGRNLGFALARIKNELVRL